MTKKNLLRNGFSLFEILIVMTLFAIIVFIANQTFISSIRSGTKSDIQQRVKANANYIFSVMERSLHSSRRVSLCSPGIGTNPTTSQIKYFDNNNVEQTFTCSAGASGTFTSTALGQTGSPQLLSSSDVAVTSCNITCEVTNSVTIVTIELTLKQAASSADLRAEDKDTFKTQTKVTIRND